jgi:hypothetical protein
MNATGSWDAAQGRTVDNIVGIEARKHDMPVESRSPGCRACNSGKAMRNVDAGRNASNITVSREDTVGYVLAFPLICDLL